jgi:hypothetical protein
MLRLLKAEISYNLLHISIAVAVPLAIYSVIFLSGIFSIDGSRTLSKVIIPLLIGFGPAAYLTGNCARSVHEGRIRKWSILPLNKVKTASAKMIFAFAPLAGLFVILFLFNFILLNNENILSQKIMYSCGVYFLLISFLINGYDIVQIKKNLNRKKFDILFITMLIIFIAIILLGDIYLSKFFTEAELGFLFFIIGLITIILDAFLFTKRTNYLI